MMNNKGRFFSIPEKPLTSDEINERMFNRTQERARQDAEIRRKHNIFPTVVYQIPEKPLTSDEINDRMFNRMQERARQDAEMRREFSFNK